MLLKEKNSRRLGSYGPKTKSYEKEGKDNHLILLTTVTFTLQHPTAHRLLPLYTNFPYLSFIKPSK